MASVLYLSPNLEVRDLMFVIAVVAHELAHIFCNHSPLDNTPEVYEKQEREAWRIVAAWGFEKEKRTYVKIREKEARESSRSKEQV